MPWKAYTTSGTIGPNTTLHILSEPQTLGQLPDRLVNGITLHIENTSSLRVPAMVKKVSPTEVEIETSDGSRWRLTPWTSNDLPVAINTPGLHAQDWVVRGLAATTP